MKKMVTSSLGLALLLSVLATGVSGRSISEQEMNALLDGSSEEQAVNDEQAHDDVALNAGSVQDVKPLNPEDASIEDEDAMPFGDMGQMLDNPEFQEAFAEIEKMQKEDPEKFEKMMEESMQAMQEMMQDPEAMKTFMGGMPEELMAEVAAEGKANELVNGASVAAPAA